MRKSLFKPLFFCASLAIITSCDSADRLTISGSSTVLPVVSSAAQTYRVETGTPIIVNSGGSGAGFSQLAQGLTDIGMMSRDITDAERGQYPKVSFETMAIGRDAVIPVISSEVYLAGVTALSPEQIAAMYTGEITNWRDVGGPDREILVIDKEASRGTRHIFMSVIMGDKHAKAAGADLVLGSNNEEQTALVQSDSAIGMLSMAWLNDDIRGVALTLPSGVIEPDTETITAGQYPISRNLTIILRQDASPDARAFANYLLGPQGQNAVEVAGYIRLDK